MSWLNTVEWAGPDPTLCTIGRKGAPGNSWGLGASWGLLGVSGAAGVLGALAGLLGSSVGGGSWGLLGPLAASHASWLSLAGLLGPLARPWASLGPSGGLLGPPKASRGLLASLVAHPTQLLEEMDGIIPASSLADGVRAHRSGGTPPVTNKLGEVNTVVSVVQHKASAELHWPRRSAHLDAAGPAHGAREDPRPTGARSIIVRNPRPTRAPPRQRTLSLGILRIAVESWHACF